MPPRSQPPVVTLAAPAAADAAPAVEPAPVADPVPVDVVVEERVRARWVSPQACLVPGVGVVRYGDELMVSAGQLAHPDQPTIPWDDAWTPDPVLAVMADQEG